MSMNRTCFIDADVLITAVAGRGAEAKQARALFEALQTGKVRAMADSLVAWEVFYGIERQKGREFAVTFLKSLLGLDSLRILPIDQATVFEALRISGRCRLKGNDLLHYTVALLHSVEAIYSYDKDFDGLEIERREPQGKPDS